jgi:hypothetical protein
MASLVSTGSPRSSRRTTPTIKVFDDGQDEETTPTAKVNVTLPRRHTFCLL